jgi:hypothetical protein
VGLLVHHLAGDRLDVLAAPDPSGRDCGLGDGFFWQGCLPDAESAFYFSGVTYTTVGYGDLVLPKPWRILAPIEALTGLLMCALSGGLFFAVVSRRISNWVKERENLVKPKVK